MNNLRIALALIIVTMAPSLYAKFNDGVVPSWMVGLFVVGLIAAAVAFFMPSHKDIDPSK